MTVWSKKGHPLPSIDSIGNTWRLSSSPVVKGLLVGFNDSKGGLNLYLVGSNKRVAHKFSD